MTSSELFAPPPPASHTDLYAPFAAAVEALRRISCDTVARTTRRMENADPEDSLQAAASRMGWRKVGALAVVQDGRLVGALSEDDLLRVTAQRLAELAPHVTNVGDALVLWQDLLDGLRVGDVMTPYADLALAEPGLDMVSGIARICATTRFGTRFRYLWILDDAGAVQRVVSVRDMARFLTRIYDGDLANGGAGGAGEAEELRVRVAGVLDLSIGAIRTRLALGHGPSLIRVEATGEETVARMWGDRRGYVLTTLRDGAALGICTRRDLVRGLRDPFADLGDLRVANLMSGQVKTVTDGNTLGGLFKLMAIEGCRHMPLVDSSDRVVRMISMWEALALFAPRRDAAT